MMERSKDSRIHSLDVLRGIAVLLVLFRHLPSRDASTAFVILQRIGWVGVDLFFVLSGFLISGLLFSEFDKTGELNVKRFWLRRGFKIWPSYFFTYGGAMLLTILATGDLSLFVSRAPNYVFIQNYMPEPVRWTHSWSIAIEEHFYLALPIVLLLLVPKRLPWLPKICVFVCAIVLLIRIILSFSGGVTWENFYYQSHLRIDSLSFGVLLGYFHHYHRDAFLRFGQRFSPVLLVVGLAGFIFAFMFRLEYSPWSYTVGFSVLYLTFGGLVIAASSYTRFGSVGPPKLVATVGVYSYTVYLAHSVMTELPGAGTVRRFVFANFGDAGDRIVIFAGAIILGILISHLVERPFLRLRARLLPSNKKPVHSKTKDRHVDIGHTADVYAGGS